MEKLLNEFLTWLKTNPETFGVRAVWIIALIVAIIKYKQLLVILVNIFSILPPYWKNWLIKKIPCAEDVRIWWIKLKKKIEEEGKLANSKEEQSSQEIEKLCNHLIDTYDSFLKQKLGGELEIPLQITPANAQPGAKSEESNNIDFLGLLDTYKTLLVLGSAGAGKSTMVYQIALKRLRDENRILVPIIFDIASWEKYVTNEEPTKDDFSDWLISVILETTTLKNKEIVKQLVSGSKNNDSLPLLIPIFDGFDELALNKHETKKQEIRKKFMECHNDYTSNYSSEYGILTSRNDDLVYLEKSLHESYTIVQIQPFTYKHLISQLGSLIFDEETKQKYTSRNRLLNLLTTLDEKSPLVEVLTIPFYFHVTCKLIRDCKFQFQLNRSKKEYEDFILDNYTHEAFKQLEKGGFQQEYLPKYMKYLAYILHDNNAVTFELTDVFQLRYLISKKIYFLVHILLALALIGIGVGLCKLFDVRSVIFHYIFAGFFLSFNLLLNSYRARQVVPINKISINLSDLFSIETLKKVIQTMKFYLGNLKNTKTNNVKFIYSFFVTIQRGR